MKPQSENELVDLIIKWVKEDRQTTGFASPQITKDTNLMESGLVDSIGFVELILFVESQTGNQIDVSDVDPSEFAVVKHLSRIAVRSLQRA